MSLKEMRYFIFTRRSPSEPRTTSHFHHQLLQLFSTSTADAGCTHQRSGLEQDEDNLRPIVHRRHLRLYWRTPAGKCITAGNHQADDSPSVYRPEHRPNPSVQACSPITGSTDADVASRLVVSWWRGLRHEA